MTKEKFLFCRVAWMNSYDGLANGDTPLNGGSFVEEDNIPHEIFNFKKVKIGIEEKCFGFVHPSKKWTGINLKRIDNKNISQDKDGRNYVDNVLVVWAAKNPMLNKLVCVGGYKNARVYEKFVQWEPINNVKEIPRNRIDLIKKDLEMASKRGLLDKYNNNNYLNENFPYIIEAKADDCVLLPTHNRNLEFFNSSTNKKSILGQSQIGYGQCEKLTDSLHCEQLKKDILSLI